MQNCQKNPLIATVKNVIRTRGSALNHTGRVCVCWTAVAVSHQPVGPAPVFSHTNSTMHAAPPNSISACSTSVQITASKPPKHAEMAATTPSTRITVGRSHPAMLESARDAVNMTIAIQPSLSSRNSTLPSTRTRRSKRCSRYP